MYVYIVVVAGYQQMAEKILSSDYSDLCQHLQSHGSNAVMVRLLLKNSYQYYTAHSKPII